MNWINSVPNITYWCFSVVAMLSVTWVFRSLICNFPINLFVQKLLRRRYLTFSFRSERIADAMKIDGELIIVVVTQC